jgi:glutamine cyclotransferase
MTLGLQLTHFSCMRLSIAIRLSCFFLADVLAWQWGGWGEGSPASSAVAAPHPSPILLTYDRLAELKHDSAAFTQGLEFDRVGCDGQMHGCTEVFLESTGLHGQSSVRRVDVKTGEVLLKSSIEHKWFGEGLTKMVDKIYQITWQTAQGFIFNASDMKQIGTFTTELSDGWGLANNGTHLILTDSSHILYFVDPVSFKTVGSVNIHDGGRHIPWLNELEVVENEEGKKELLANVWQTECIAKVNLTTGRITHWALMHGLLESLKTRPGARPMDVLNGIAWDKAQKRLFVTGKLWPSMFEVKLRPFKQGEQALTIEQARTKCWPHPARAGQKGELKADR